MTRELYSNNNNLFQSEEWAAFQATLGRKNIEMLNSRGIELSIPFGRKFIWLQKGPENFSINNIQLTKISKNTVFVRLEPGIISGIDIKKHKLKIVTKNSLLSGQASPKATRILDLTKSEEELLVDMKPKTRYNIRLAEKKGVTVKKTTDSSVLYQMLIATSKKGSGYHPHESKYYDTLMKSFSKNELVNIYVAELKGEPLAAVMVTNFGKTATYLHGGQNVQKRNLMAPYLCQWTAILDAKKRGCEYYDFWGVSETDDPNDSWAGITRFKDGFGGKKMVFPGSFDLVLKPFWYNILTLSASIKHIVRR